MKYKFLIVSLGIYIIIQNLISIFFGDDEKNINNAKAYIGNEILGAHFTNLQLFTVLTSIFIYLSIGILLLKTKFGLNIRAIQTDPILSYIYGIDINKIIYIVLIIVSILASTSGILIGLDIGITPDYGFHFYFYGIIVVTIGGFGNYYGLIFGTLLLSFLQHFSSYFFDSRWIDIVSYSLFIFFLIYRPLGFSGNKIRKIEI